MMINRGVNVLDYDELNALSPVEFNNECENKYRLHDIYFNNISFYGNLISIVKSDENRVCMYYKKSLRITKIVCFYSHDEYASRFLKKILFGNITPKFIKNDDNDFDIITPIMIEDKGDDEIYTDFRLKIINRECGVVVDYKTKECKFLVDFHGQLQLKDLSCCIDLGFLYKRVLKTLK